MEPSKQPASAQVQRPNALATVYIRNDASVALDTRTMCKKMDACDGRFLLPFSNCRQATVRCHGGLHRGCVGTGATNALVIT